MCLLCIYDYCFPHFITIFVFALSLGMSLLNILFFLKKKIKNRYVVIIVNTFACQDVYFRASPTPWGPWGNETFLYTLPDSFTSDGKFCYAGKHHPELARDPAKEMVRRTRRVTVSLFFLLHVSTCMLRICSLRLIYRCSLHCTSLLACMPQMHMYICMCSLYN
jgi:hypothetical protein